MKRLLTSTTALSLVLSPLGANPAFAQFYTENGSVIAVDGTLLCDASGGAVCDASLYVEQAAAIEARVRQEEEAAAEQKRLEEEAAALAEQQRLDDEAAAAAEQQRLADEAAAAEQQRLLEEAAALEQQRLADEALAAEQQRLAEEEAAAEQQRLADEAAAAEQQRLADETAAAEQQRLADEAAAEQRRLADEAEAERLRLEEEAKAADADADEQQRQQDEAIAASQQKPDDEALAKASANVPANMILTDDGSLLAENNSLLCDVVVSGTCDPALYVEQADAISRQMLAEREAAANATLNPDASQTDTMTSVATDGADIETLRATLESEKAFLLKMEAQGNTDAARQSQRNVAFLEQEILVRENAAIQPDSAEDFAGRKEALKLLADYRRALDQVNIDIAQEEVNNPGNVEILRQYKAKIETDIEEINHFLATGGGTKLPSDKVPPMPETTQPLAEVTITNLADDPRSVEELRAEYAKAETGLLIATQQEDADQVLWREQQMADLQARIDAKIAAGNGATPVATADGSGGTEPAEILPPNLIRTGDGSLLAEDNTILCDTTVVEVCNAADYVAKANEITAFLDSQSDKGMDAEVTLPTTPVVDPSAGLVSTQPVDPGTLTPVAPIQPKSTEAMALSDILVTPTVGEVLTPTVVAGTALAGGGLLPQGSADAPVAPLPLTEIPSSKDATVVIETMTDANTRNSSQEFAAAPVTLADGRRTGLTAFETVGLVALGALIVGAVINEGRKDERRVVSNTGDRVVVLKPDGTYQVYKDDDTVLRRPGSTVRTETFNDGSTRTIVQRVDGSQIVTIRDASGRVLRRAQYDKFGRERLLIDDFQPEEPVIITDLPRPKKDRIVISSKDEDAALKARMAALEAKKAKRGFSLRQIREIAEVRDLAAQIDVESITFDSGSAAIKAAEAENLADLGQLMQELLEANPGEMFLIEGHTDATGHPAMNLALSDRRAESVALALAEYFDIPPENLVVQGYGESELLIDTQKDERANRRVLVRVITPLLKRAGG